MRILLIDDDKVFSEPLRWQLGQEGHEVIYCQSIEDVLDEKGKLKVPRPDCILLDIMMPSWDRYSKSETGAGKDTGFRLLEDIQKEVPNTPVVIITVRSDLVLTDLRKKFVVPIKEILVKPKTPTQVVETIRSVFPNHSV